MANIVIVDDSNLIVKLMSARLTQRGHQIVATGSDGNQGVELYGKHLPDLMLLDITMPNKDGRECLQEVMKAHPQARVVMLSSVNTDEVIGECIKLGAQAFINKAEISQKDVVEDAVEKILARVA